ncbi:hypothetical protein EV383_6264 [Pseudonocardia sediminis]|uniref:Uncharacterized protein n=1 Tax=Pseudonocardia sediminis TaxID=1397368 RepID=A0A4Q7UA96_PSEST|nr:hypothetical protein [Pseudonocardia sediminis]RZT75523.1 hypothetical protein EV383_6264 [Pseudonocardia sediminis]
MRQPERGERIIDSNFTAYIHQGDGVYERDDSAEGAAACRELREQRAREQAERMADVDYAAAAREDHRDRVEALQMQQAAELGYLDEEPEP